VTAIPPVRDNFWHTALPAAAVAVLTYLLMLAV